MRPRTFSKTLFQISLLALTATIPLWSQRCAGQAAMPAPFPGWGQWQSVGECGGVRMSIALSNDDGRNDFEVKLRMENTGNHRVAARLDANLTSDQGESKVYHPGTVMNPGTTAEGGALSPSLSFGTVFRSAVFANVPPRITRFVFQNIEVAQVDVSPANADPSTYLRTFGDHPTTHMKISMLFSK